MFEINDKLTFGQYKGLTIKEIFQGTIFPDKEFMRDYLDHVLNNLEDPIVRFPEFEFISRFEVGLSEIRTIGEIFDPNKPLNEHNRVVLGNLQTAISSLVNIHFKPNFLGIGIDIRAFNKAQQTPQKIGGDPEYLIWCERNISNFQISEQCKEELASLPVARLTGFDFFYIGNETYEYRPKINIETFKFNIDSKAAPNDDGILSDESNYSNLDEFNFNEGFDGDIDSWNHFNE